MEFANRSSGGSSQHHGNSCPYFDQSPHRPAAAQPESFHGHAFGWQQPPAAYHQQWSAPPPSAMDIQHSPQGLPQLRMPQADHYQYHPGALPPPQQQQQQQQQSPAGFQSGSATDASYGTSGAMSSSGSQASASTAPNGTRSFHQAHNSRLPGQAPGPPAHMAQPHTSTQFPSPPQQTQHPTSSHTPSHPSQTHNQHPLPPHHLQFPPHGQTQSAPHHSPSANSFSSSSSPADTPSLAGHQRLHIQHQQYLSAMSSSNQPGPGGVPSQHGHPPHADSAAQYANGQGQAGQEQRQLHSESQAHQPHQYQRPPNPSVAYPPMASQPINIPQHLPPLLNPNHMQHHYGHGYMGTYSENIPSIPANPRDLPRHAPPSAAPTTSEHRRRTVSSRPTRRSGAQAPPVSSERDHDLDDETSSTSSVGSSVDNAVNSGSMRHAANDRQLRAAQLFRGSVTTRKVASSSAISSLQSVDVESLSAAERNCVICYNDFGTETPEGVREAPLRLPKCKHVFGDHCIKKWFEESDSCPYCRTKVPSDLRFMADGRALMELMRARGGTLPVDLNGQISQEAILRLVATHGAAGYDMPGGIRRSPPTESGEQRRRIRPRHSGSMSSPPRADGSSGGNSRPLSFGAVPSSSNNPSSPRERHPLGDHARAQGREREWSNLQRSRANGRPAQAQMPANMYNPFPWEEPFGDPTGRLPMPVTGGPPPMGGMPPQNTQQQNTTQHAHSAAPPFQPNPTAFPYIQSLGLRAQREAGSTGLPNPSLPTGGFHATEVNATAVDTDTPMPDRAPVP